MVSPVPAEEVLARLRPAERRWIEDFRDSLRAELGSHLRDLRIFGSKVRGDDHPESDIDLLVLVESLDSPTDQHILRMAKSISVWLQPVTQDYERYHAPISRASGFYKEMRKESVRL